MAPLLSPPDISQLPRIADLSKLRDQLLSDDPRTRYQCLYYRRSMEVYCDRSCGSYSEDHRNIFNKARALCSQEVEEIQKENLITILRTLFCGDHDPLTSSERSRTYKPHFEKLWEGATVEMRNEFWIALRNSGRGINKPVATTPRRSPRPPARKIASAPSKPSQKESTIAGNVSPSSTLNSETPCRPSTSGPALPHLAERSGDSMLGTPCPNPARVKQEIVAEAAIPLFSLPTRPKAEIPAADLPENQCSMSASIAHHGASNLPTSRPMGDVQGDSSAQETSAPDRSAQDIKAHTRRNLVPVSRRKAAVPKSQPDQTVEQSNPPSRGKMLETEAGERRAASQEATKKFLMEPVHAKEHNVPSILPEKALHQTLEDTPGSVRETVEADSPSTSTLSPISIPQTQRRKSDASSAQGKDVKPCVFAKQLPQTIAHAIDTLLKKNITPKRGFIYVLAAPEFFQSFPPARNKNEQWVKIGISSDVKHRVKTLKATCGITDLAAVYESPCSFPMDMLRRIEKVCHEELNNHRRRFDCLNEGVTTRCDTVHEEWFAVDKEAAERTVKKWEGFLIHKPYDQYGRLSTFWWDRLQNEDFYRFDSSDGEATHGLMHRKFESWLDKSSRELGKRTIG